MSNRKFGKKVIVIGSPGSGKSTFSQQISEVTGIPLIHLDKEYWNSGWKETPKDEWIKKQEILISGDEWIIDGNYGSTMDIRLDKADTIILLIMVTVTCRIKRAASLLSRGSPWGVVTFFDR